MSNYCFNHILDFLTRVSLQVELTWIDSLCHKVDLHAFSAQRERCDETDYTWRELKREAELDSRQTEREWEGMMVWDEFWH